MLMFTALTILGANDETLNELILRVATGDISALEELYNRTRTGIYSFALSVLKNTDDAEDVLHNTFLSIWKSAYMYTKGKPMAWMITIAKNHCYRIFRDRKWSDESEKEGVAGDFTTSFDTRTLLWQKLDLLGDDERKIIVLHAVAGFKHKETADLLNMPLSTVLSKYNRGVKKLKKLLIDGGAF